MLPYLQYTRCEDVGIMYEVYVTYLGGDLILLYDSFMSKLFLVVRIFNTYWLYCCLVLWFSVHGGLRL
jgi:hypothetical protein